MAEPEDMSRFVGDQEVELTPEAVENVLVDGRRITLAGTYDDTTPPEGLLKRAIRESGVEAQIKAELDKLGAKYPNLDMVAYKVRLALAAKARRQAVNGFARLRYSLWARAHRN